MRTVGPVVFVLVLGVAFSIVGATGLAGFWGVQDAPGGEKVEGNLEEEAGNSPADNPDELQGDVGVSGGENNIISLIINGAKILGGAAAAIGLLPLTLIELGMPPYAATPVGLFLQIIVGIGIIQFVSGRIYK